MFEIMNYKEDKTFKKSFENFICLRLLQNVNRTDIEIDKIYSECLTKTYGINSFEGLKRIGLAIEASHSKLTPEFLKLLNLSKAEKPDIGFDFLLVDDLKHMKVKDFPMKPTSQMVFYKNLFHDFYYNYFNNTYKKCDFSMTLGTLEFSIKKSGKEYTLHAFPMDGLTLMEVAKTKSKGVSIYELWRKLKDSDTVEFEKYFLKSLENLINIGILKRQDKGFSKIMSNQLTFDCWVQIDKKFFKRCDPKVGKDVLSDSLEIDLKIST
jgi:hypothetical protein